jgi:hypothetical protein
MDSLPPIKAGKPGRPPAIPAKFHALVCELYARGYGYRAIARILSSPEHGLNPHYSSVRNTLIQMGKITGMKKTREEVN